MIKYFEGESIELEKLGPIDGYEFIECEFVKQDLSSNALKNSTFVECTFKNCNLSNVDFLNSSFRDVKFHSSKLVGINFSSLKTLMDLDFESCVLDFAVFQEVSLEGTKFLQSSLKEVDFSDSNLQKTDFSGSDLSGCIFNGADLSFSNLRNARHYFIDPHFTKIKKAKFSLPEAVSLLRALNIDLD